MNIKKIPMKEIKFIAFFIIAVLIFVLLSYNVSRAYINKVNFEQDILDQANKNEETIFSIDNITMFSSANADGEINPNSTLELSNIYQYTDIAIFINPNSEDLDYKNTLKEVYIDNINYVSMPNVGTPSLYYKNINDFATASYNSENAVNDSLYFSISSEETTNLDTPILYNNCANPITLTYVNIVKDTYTTDDANGQLTYDGSLLKKCNVTLSSIVASITFDIHITNNLDQKFVCPVCLNIPLELEDGTSIYDGKILNKENTNYTFYRYE